MSEKKLPVLPMRGSVLFPGPTVPIAIHRASSLRAVDEAMAAGREVFVVGQRDEADEVSRENLHTLGVVAHIGAIQRGIRGTQILLTGQHRAIALDYTAEELVTEGEQENGELLRARVVPVKSLSPIRPSDPAFEALHRELRGRALELGLQRGLEREMLRRVLDQVEDPGALADLVCSQLELPAADQQTILETLGVEDRMRRVLVQLQRQIDVARSRKMIQKQVSDELQGRQKEMYLREQLRAIQRELGDDGEGEGTAELRARLEAMDLPAEVREEALRELSRLERAGGQSSEAQVIRTYLQWIEELPWSQRSDERLDLARAEQILEGDHFGLGAVKDRVLEFLSVRKLRQLASTRDAPSVEVPPGEPTEDLPAGATGGAEPDPADDEPAQAGRSRSPILLFTGPPGVGKTSVARSVARALGRKYVRIALGGARDEADIRGHRRTYVGAMPGRIIQGLKRAGTKNPVVLLDEVDKLGASHQGDPASALLEVLDPAQNQHFTDHYLNVPFDLSEVLFIATANVTHAIAPALLDRMEVVEFSGYTEREKLEIARRYLVPRQLEESGLATSTPRPELRDDALGLLISGYTRESGVRQLEGKVAAVTRKLARAYAGEAEPDPVVNVTRVRQLLGRPRVHPERIADRHEIGIATGMYYTPMGGDIMFVEAALRSLRGSSLRDGSLRDSQGFRSSEGDSERREGGWESVSLILTGQLGDVMKESARAALTYAASHAHRLQIPGRHGPCEAHVHVPAGAVPKDGPSAGVTIATALISAMSGRPIRRDVAMTGEITLTGRVLPVGGIKEKVLGAERAGARLVVLPRANAADLEDLPTEVLEKLQVRFADTLDDVLGVALLDAAAAETDWLDAGLLADPDGPRTAAAV